MQNKGVIELLIEANRRNISLFLEKDQLKYSLKDDVVPDEEIINELRNRKEEIKLFLQKNKKSNSINSGVIPRVDRTLIEHIPLSFAQERLWFIDKLEGSNHYHIPLLLNLDQQIKPQGIEEAINAMLVRHEILRTVYPEDENGPYQSIIPQPTEILKQSFLDGDPSKEEVANFIRKPFDLSNEGVFRAWLINKSKGDRLLVIVIHHIAFDGWSQPIFISELKQFYSLWAQGAKMQLPELKIQYADFAIHQKKQLQGEKLEEMLAYWEGSLKGVSPVALPTDFSRPALQSTRGDYVSRTLPGSCWHQVRKYAVEQGVTPFVVLMSVLKVLISRYSGQSDICIGSPVANRPKSELEPLIGFFVNTLAIRSQVDESESFSDLVNQVYLTTLGAFDHQDVPFEKIVDRLGLERDMSRPPLVQVIFVLNEGSKQVDKNDEGLVKAVPQGTKSSKFDLALSVTATGGEVKVGANYCSDLFEASTMERFVEYYQQLLNKLLEKPETALMKVPLLNSDQQTEILSLSRGSDFPVNGIPLIERLSKCVKQFGNKKVLYWEEKSMTYQELDLWSNHLAHQLQSRGITEDSRVGVYLTRTPELVVALVAILKCGGVYVPVNPILPDERVRYMLETVNAELLLTAKDEYHQDLGLETLAVESGIRSAFDYVQRRPENPNYVIFTSGSTGKPKGVQITDASVINLVDWSVREFKITEKAVATVAAGVSFDASILEIYPYIFTGGAIHLIDDELLLELPDMVTYMETHNVTHSFLATALVREFTQITVGKSMSLAYLLTGGDVLGLVDVTQLSYQLYNNYGPTENTVVSTTYKLDDKDSNKVPPIGRPIDGTSAYVLDDHKQLVPIGVEGDLYLGGGQLSDGYVNQEQLTQEVFLPNPFVSGEKMYRSGDRAKWGQDGQLYYLGRHDDQVSVRGYRIELGEVQSVLSQLPGVEECLVLLQETDNGAGQLVGYIKGLSITEEDSLITALKALLPAYMIPANLVFVDQFVLTPNGKIDRNQLPSVKSRTVSPTLLPKSASELALAGIWSDLLKLPTDQIGLESDFFRIGGHSLLATRLATRIVQSLGVPVTVRNIFTHATLGALSHFIDQQQEEIDTIKPSDRPVHVPLSFAQERLWFIDRLEGGTQYHIPSQVPLHNNTDTQALQQAYSAMINRHEILRTLYREKEGVPYQIILPAKQQWSLEVIESDAKAFPDYLRKFNQRLFDLSQEIPIRAELIRLDDGGYQLIMVIHHIAFDGWSQSVFEQELIAFYHAFEKGEDSNLPTMAVQYADYTLWQKKHFTAAWFNKELKFWEDRLQGITTLELITDFNRPPVVSYAGKTFSRQLSLEATRGLKQLSHQCGATMFMTLQTALSILLSHYGRTRDIVLGTPVANRDQKEIEHLIGFFVNTLVLRNELAEGLSVQKLIERVKESTLEAYEHQQVPFEKIVERIETSRDMSRHPIFQVMMLLHVNGNGASPKERQDHHASNAKFDLTIAFTETKDQPLSIGFSYSSALFKASSMDLMMDQLLILLEGMARKPEVIWNNLSLVASAKMKGTDVGLVQQASNQYEAKTIIERYQDAVSLYGSQTALRFEDQSLTYDELDAKSNQMSHFLQSVGVKEGDLVAIDIERSPELVIAIYGILKAAAAYVPLDREQPLLRRTYILEQVASSFLITDYPATSYSTSQVRILQLDEIQNNLSSQNSQTSASIPSPDHTAYVIFTSGSTGTPKGVQIAHKSLHALVKGVEARYPTSVGDVMLLKTNYVFDVSCHELFGWFLSGGQLAILAPGKTFDPEYLVSEIDRYRVTHVNFVPSMLRLVLEHIESTGNTLDNLKYVFSAGEPLPPSLVQLFRDLNLSFKLENLYGPTEATVYTTAFSTEEFLGTSLVPIGKPLPHVATCVMDKSGDLLPFGIPGELCLGGDAVALGYLKAPEKTDQVFFEGPLGLVWYKTGDLVRMLPDGNIEYLGRNDDQVKLRGFRIELSEIDASLQKVEGVHLSVTRVEGEEENRRLITYYEGAEVSSKTLREHLVKILPAYMVPDQFVFLPALPLLPSGKVNKSKLQAPKSTVHQEANLLPITSTALILQSIWSELLQVSAEGIGMESDFFGLGGHSLLVIRMISRVKASLQVELKVRDIFQFPTLGALATYLEGSKAQDNLSMSPLSRPVKIPLSFAQERIWFIDKLEGSQQYHIPVIIPLGKEVKSQGINFAINELCKRHEILRTVYLQDKGEPYQQVMSAEDQELEVLSVSQEHLGRLIDEVVKMPFDLTADRMLRARFIQTANGSHLVLVIHHIAFDGWSQPILMNELTSFYRQSVEGSDHTLESLPLQYADYSIWQRELIKGKVLQEELSFWEQALVGVETLQLPTDFDRPQIQSGKGAFVSMQLSDDTSAALKSFSRENQVTLYMTLMSAYHVFLYRYTRQEDICVGTPMANRSNSEVEGLIGLFVNTLVIRSRLDPNLSFEALLRQMKAFILDAHQHAEVPFEKVVERVEKHRDLSRHPLIQTMFNLQQGAKASKKQARESVFENQSKRENALFDLSLIAIDQGERISLTMEYASDLFEQQTVKSMLRHFHELLLAIVEAPVTAISSLRLLSKADQKHLLDTKSEIDQKSDNILFLAAFERHVKQHPNATACISTEEQLTYLDLDRQSDQLALEIMGKGVRQGDRVVILMDRSVNWIRSVLALMKVGAVYVPVDHGYPSERKQYIIDDTAAVLIITDSQQESFDCQQLVPELTWDDVPKQEISLQPLTEDLAYLIYTSGTTGEPKGVMITQESLAIRLAEEVELLKISRDDRTITSTNHVFDVSVLEIFLPLYAGASISILDRAGTEDLRKLSKRINADGVTVLQSTPSMLDALLDVKEENANWESIRLICLGGESLSEKLVDKVRERVPQSQINNHYGPTEATVDALILSNITSFEKNLIGQSLPSVWAYVLNGALELNPVGVPGELCLSGGGIASGYWNKPGVTKKHFVKDPYRSGLSLYRTGDLVRQLPDGNIEFLGRIDHQVKIRGFRLELGEVEKTLLGIHGVDQCVVDVMKGATGENELVSWVKNESTLDESDLRQQLSKKLPPYMMPTYFLAIEEMPLTINGKIDRKALPRPELTRASAYVAPTDALQKQLVEIWADLLQLPIDKIGIADNFFEIGGHSLLAVRLMARIAEMLYIELPISTLFEHATVQTLSARIEQVSSVDQDGSKGRLLTVHSGTGEHDLFFVPGAGGNPMVFYPLGSHCDKSSLFAFEAQGLDGHDTPLLRVEELADQYVAALLEKTNRQSFTLGGYSFGGKIAFEMAMKLSTIGYEVDRLILFDALIPDHEPEKLSGDESEVMCKIAELFAHMNGKNVPIQSDSIRQLEESDKFEEIHRELIVNGLEVTLSQIRGFINVYKANLQCTYKPEIRVKSTFDVLHFIATHTDDSLKNHHFDWSPYTEGAVTTYMLGADHFSILQEPYATKIASKLRLFLG